MPQTFGGSGKVRSSSGRDAVRADFGPQLPPILDLNRAKLEDLADHPAVGRLLALKLVALRRRGRIATPADAIHEGWIKPDKRRRFEAFTYGATRLGPVLEPIVVDGGRAFVDEAFTLRISWLDGVARPDILSLVVRFPSGRGAEIHLTVTDGDRSARQIAVSGFVSGESGEFYARATLRDSAGRVSQQSAVFGVFTRNPVQIWVRPQFMTQSGRAGAPKFNFTERRWYCSADVRWVNGERRAVNLGRRVDVRITDAGVGEIASLSFNLSGDIVIPASSTVYGNWFTWHSGGPVFDVFHAKGDLTFTYSMSGSGFTPARAQVWRTMRTIGYNIIRVGDFTNDERSEYRRAAAEIASGIYQSRDMSVYGVELYRIEGTREMDADKERFRFIDSQEELDALRSKYTVNNWFLDVFFIEGYWTGGFGRSPVNGPVDKEGDKSGIIIRRDGDTVNLGQTFAHEAGHYLGLEHADENDGCDDTDPSAADIADNFIFSTSRRDSAVITGCQINKLRQHGLVRSMTP